MRTCEACGRPLPVGCSPNRKFCDDTCRKRGSRVPAEVVELRPSGSVVAATTAALEASGRLNTPAGQAALVLAGRLDLGADTGSAMASMTKELRSALAEATAGVPAQADGVDEIKAQAEKRRRLAGSGAR